MIILVVAMVGCVPTPEPTQDFEGPGPGPGPGAVPCTGVPLSPDEVDGDTVYCGELSVPENWDSPGGRQLKIEYLVARSTGETTAPDPVVYLEGGPGPSALMSNSAILGSLADVRQSRDVILFDYRGLLWSSILTCPVETEAGMSAADLEASGTDLTADPLESAAADSPIMPGVDIDTALAFVRDHSDLGRYERCAEYFRDQGVDLTRYGTRGNARDLVALMNSLNYASYNILSGSYGTRVAQAVLQDYSDATDQAALPEIRSVILDGVDPLVGISIADDPFSSMIVAMNHLGACDADPGCAAAYPGIRGRAIVLLESLQTTPRSLAGGTTVTALDLAGQLAAASTPGKVAYLPRMIAELERGDATTYLGLQNENLGITESASPEQGTGAPVAEPPPIQDLIDAAAEADRLPELFLDVAASGGAGAAGDSGAAARNRLRYYITPTQDVLPGLVSDATDQSAETMQRILDLMSTDDRARAVQLLINGSATVRSTVYFAADYAAAAMVCNDEYAILDPGGHLDGSYVDAEAPAFLRLDAAISSMTSVVQAYLQCQALGLTPQAQPYESAAVSGIPALLLSGTADDITPVDWGIPATAGLSNAKSVVVSFAAHVGSSLAGSCANQLATTFIDDPSAELDTSCASEPRVAWVLPS